MAIALTAGMTSALFAYSSARMIPLSDDQPTRRFPLVTVALIVVNALVFVGWQLRIGMDDSVGIGGFIPAMLSAHEPGAVTRLLTSLFMHGGWMHLIGNMWFLWIFGDNVEDACGPVRFVGFYLLCGVAATLAHTWAAPASLTPLVGASGAISGVLGGVSAEASARHGADADPAGDFHADHRRAGVGFPADLDGDADPPTGGHARRARRRGGVSGPHRRVRGGDGADRVF